MAEHRRDNAAASTQAASVPLDSTGVPGLDEVLGGGIQRGSLAILAGPPGGGKTILAHQIAFAAARSGRRTTILTAFSEPTNKLIAHMRPFAFFDETLLGQSLDVLSIQQFLRQGLEAAANEIIGVVRAGNAELVVLDGFRGVRETAEQPEEARRFVYDVSNRLSLLGITLLLTSEANARDVTFFPEATTADILLGLAFDAVDTRERRTLEVLKVRGAAPLPGQHTLTIGDEGVTIYPRLEARVARLAGVNRPLAAPRTLAAPSERNVPPASPAETDGAREPYGSIPTGIPGLDSLLGGGFARGTSTLVVGGHGAGKTLFGLQFALQGARLGEPTLFLTLHETTEQLLRLAQPFQWGEELRGALDMGTLTVLRTPPIELCADVLAGNLLMLLDQKRAHRLVFDDVDEIALALAGYGYTHRFHGFTAALIEALRLGGVTSLLTQYLATERRASSGRGAGLADTLSDNLLWLRRTARRDDLRRSLAVVRLALSRRSGTHHAITIQVPEGLMALASARTEGEHGSGAREGKKREEREE